LPEETIPSALSLAYHVPVHLTLPLLATATIAAQGTEDNMYDDFDAEEHIEVNCSVDKLDVQGYFLSAMAPLFGPGPAGDPALASSLVQALGPEDAGSWAAMTSGK